MARLNTAAPVPLEDEVGDVLEKGMQRAGLSPEGLATAAGVMEGRLRDAIDYRSELTAAELARVAQVLGLNEVGLCALGAGKYPLPEIGPLPFCVWPLRNAHGVGCANAYLVARCGSDTGLLFDTGTLTPGIEDQWPTSIRRLEAIYLTHLEAEHVGGLCGLVKRFDGVRAYVPEGAEHPCGMEAKDGGKWIHHGIEVTAVATPGHSAAHNCYWVRCAAGRNGSLLIAGDLLFAASVGAGYFSPAQRDASLRKILKGAPREAVVAPGHGPMTTLSHELVFNPFAGFTGLT
jgi:glyoxylase-like metal-dependent hydrolase (beta-lactamase superfamily II)